MEQKGPVRHVQNFDLLDPPDRGGDQLCHIQVGGVGLDIADDAAAFEPDHIEGADNPSRPVDDGDHLSQRTRLLGDHEPQHHTVPSPSPVHHPVSLGSMR